MALDANQVFGQIRSFLLGLSFRQRMMMIGSVVAVAAIIAGFVVMLDRNEYTTLYANLAPNEGQSLLARLATQNVPAKLSTDGATLSVPASMVDKVRLQLAAQGLPQTGRQGFELFDKPNWAGSDFSEKVNFQRALEAELERTIVSISEVESCRVHLVLPRESLFTEQERPAKAAVLVKLRGARLSDDTLNGIAYLVSSSVDNLHPEDVAIVDANGRVPLFAHGREQGTQNPSEVENALVAKLVATLGPVLGPEHVRAAVNVEYQLASTDSTQEIYDPKGSAVLTSQVSTEGGSGSPDSAAAGVPGVTSNSPNDQTNPPKPAANAADATNAQKPPDATQADSADDSGTILNDNKTYAVSRVVKHVVEPAGSIKRIYASVLVDDTSDTTKGADGKSVESHRKRSPEELKQIENLALSSLGMDPARGDRLTVENISFSPTPARNDLQKKTVADRLAPYVGQYSSLLRYVPIVILFLLVYLIVLRPIKKQMMLSFRQQAKTRERALAVVNQAALAAAPGAAAPGAAAFAAPPEMNALGAPLLADQSPESKLADTLRAAVIEKVAKEPEEIGRLVQDWISQR